MTIGNRICGLALYIIIASTFYTLTSFAGDTQMMKLTTLRNNTALKDWTTDTCVGLLTSTKALRITGLFPTGRTDDLKYQKMVIIINNFTGNGVYSMGLDNSYFEDIFGGKIVRTDFISGSVTVLQYDPATSLLKGTFSFFLYSNPPNLPQVTLRIYNAEFAAKFENELKVEAAPLKNPFTTNPGKTINYKIRVRDIFGNAVSNCEVFGIDEINKISNTKLGTTNSSGEFIYELKIDAKTTSKDYELSFVAIKQGYKTSEREKRTISVSGRYWVYSCGGLPLMTFDAGDGNEWKKIDDNSPIISHTGKSTINDVITLEGLVKIDPTAGQEALSGNFEAYVEGVTIAGTPERFNVSSGSLNFALTCDTRFKLLLPELVKKKIGGCEVSIEEFGFKDLNYAKAVTLKGKIKWQNVAKDACKSNSNTPEASSIEAQMTIAKEELGDFNIAQCSLAVSNIVFPPFPLFCIDNIGINYDGVKDAWTASGACEYNAGAAKKGGWEGKMKGTFTIQKGKFEGFSWEGKTNPGITVPGLPEFQFNGLKLATSGWSSPTWQSQNASVGGYFMTSDDMLKKKFPFLKAILGDDPVMEVELNAKLTYPFIIEGELKGKLFAFKPISVTKKWQVEFGNKAKLDVTKGMEGTGDFLKAFHFGADDFVVNYEKGSEQSALWADQFSYSTSAQAKLRIPDMPGDVPDGTIQKVIKILKGLGALPHDLGMAFTYLRLNSTDGLKASAGIDLQQNPIAIVRSLGRVGIEVGISTKPYIKLQAMDKTLSTSVQRTKGDAIQSPTPDNGTIAAVPLDTFKVRSNIDRVFIGISSLTSVPVSTIISPSGERISATKSDSSIILFKSADNKDHFWVIIRPTLGDWKLEITNPAPTDSVVIEGLPVFEDKPFALNATQSGNTVTATWNGSGYGSNDRIDIFLNERSSGSGGFVIGNIPATAGTFNYTLADSLPACTYYVYGIRVADGITNTLSYAPTELQVSKPTLAPPQAISISTTSLGQATINWTPVSNSNVTRYGVYIKSRSGNDSLLTTAQSSLQSVYVECDTALLRTLYVVSFDANGAQGCPGKPTQIIVSVQDDYAVFANSSSPIVVAPQPAQDILRFMVTTQSSSDVTIELYDMLGNKVLASSIGGATTGSTSTLSLSSLPNGCYILRAFNTDVDARRIITVAR
jgi:hypothetical protein